MNQPEHQAPVVIYMTDSDSEEEEAPAPPPPPVETIIIEGLLTRAQLDYLLYDGESRPTTRFILSPQARAQYNDARYQRTGDRLSEVWNDYWTQQQEKELDKTTKRIGQSSAEQ
jgi:hypothetical protein